MAVDLVASGARGASSFLAGEVVHVTGNRLVARAQANVAGNYSGAVGVALGENFLTDGFARVLLDAGLVPVAGDTLYVSAATPGRATNVAPANQRTIGTIFDASSYVRDRSVIVVLAGALNTPTSGGVQFEPARTLFVAQSWPVGADPVVFFTTVPAAMTQAAVLAPTKANPVRISVAPGTYPLAITHVSDVDVSGMGGDRFAVQLSGGVTWTPGAGVNAAKAGLDEQASYSNLQLGAIAIDASAKTGGTSVFETIGVRKQAGATTHTGRVGVGRPDSLFLSDTDHSAASITLNETQFSSDAATVTAAITANLNSNVLSSSTQVVGTMDFNDTSSADMTGIRQTGNLTNNGTGLVSSQGSKHGTVTQVDVNGGIDVRGSIYTSLVGPGPINRTNDFFVFSSGGGGQVITFTVPYLDADYSVAYVCTTSAATSALEVLAAAPAPTGFSIIDPVGGDDFLFTITHR